MLQKKLTLLEDIDRLGTFEDDFKGVAPVTYAKAVMDGQELKQKVLDALKEKEKEVEDLDNTEESREGFVLSTELKQKLHLNESFEEDEADLLNESLRIDTTLSSFHPWAGAVEVWENIVEADKVEALDSMLEEMYPDGMTETALNDLLRFDSEWVYKMLHITPKEPVEDETDSI